MNVYSIDAHTIECVVTDIPVGTIGAEWSAGQFSTPGDPVSASFLTAAQNGLGNIDSTLVSIHPIIVVEF